MSLTYLPLFQTNVHFGDFSPDSVFDEISGACLRIPELRFPCGVLIFKYVELIVLNQGCCESSQNNLPDRTLRLDANTNLLCIVHYILLYITYCLVNITYQSGDQYHPSMHSWDSCPW